MNLVNKFCYVNLPIISSVNEGTGNGMAKSLLDSVGDPCTITNAVLAIIRGFELVTTVTIDMISFYCVDVNINFALNAVRP